MAKNGVSAEIKKAHNAGESHASIARRLDRSRQYVGDVVKRLGLRPRSEILDEQRKAKAKEDAKAKAQRAKRAAEVHLSPFAERLSLLWKNPDYSTTDMARLLMTTPSCVMKTAAHYRRDFPDTFPRRGRWWGKKK